MGATTSGRRKIGERETYFPPFVNERFDGPAGLGVHVTALLNGANVGLLGNQEPTHAEVRKLAERPATPTLSGGSRFSHMLTAMRALQEDHATRSASSAPCPRGLASGWALVRARDLGQLPSLWRRHANTSMGTGSR